MSQKPSIGFDNILGEISSSSEGPLKYPDLEPEKGEVSRREETEISAYPGKSGIRITNIVLDFT